jgi:hypothetical protein
MTTIFFIANLFTANLRSADELHRHRVRSLCALTKIKPEFFPH